VLPRPLLIALTILISLAWLANLAIGYIDPPRAIPAVHTIFGIVAGSLFALGQKDNAVAAIKKAQAKRARPPVQDEPAEGVDEA
jgi:ABC-type amino acid transport system permease subunit